MKLNGKSITVRNLLFIALFVVSSFWMGACDSDVVTGSLLSGDPYLTPEYAFTGLRVGYRSLEDRNGNIRELARVERRCEKGDGLTGLCEDTIYYRSRQEPLKSSFQWRVHYLDSSRFQLQWNSKDAGFAGTMVGNPYRYLLNGHATIPLSSQSGRVKKELHILSGPGEPMLELDDYSYWTIPMGSVRTLWKRP